MKLKHLALFTVAALGTIAGARSTADAQILDASRCANAFGVTSTVAQARYAWALFCKANPATGPGGSPIPGTQYLTDASQVDYNAAQNATLRPFLFPTYFSFTAGGPWDIPTTAYTPANNCGANPSAINVGLCVAGCYVEGTSLQFASGEMGIKAAATSGKLDLVTLSPDATLDNLQFTTNKVERYITDARDDIQTIYTLTMKSGGQLKVTNEHPLLDSTGVIRQAQGLHIGDELVRANGKPDAIASIEVNKIFGKVYNVKPVSTDYVSNIVVAGGYLNGSVRYQNEFLSTINSLILRRSLTDQADFLTL